MLLTIASSQLSAQDSLSDALAIEGLLFAAYAISLALSDSVGGGRGVFFTSGTFAWMVWLVITLVAIAAASSLLSAYDFWHVHGGARVRAYGLAAGVVGPVVIAAIINVESSVRWFRDRRIG
jgi:hypothetical protein